MPWQLKALILGITLATGLATGWVANGWRLNAKIALLEASHAQAYAKAQETARAKEQALIKQSEKLRRTKDAQIKVINTRLADAINSLRKRPETRMSPDTTVSVGCTGAQLAKRDGEFLQRYAADAAKLKSALDQCAASYESARKALE